MTKTAPSKIGRFWRSMLLRLVLLHVVGIFRLALAGFHLHREVVGLQRGLTRSVHLGAVVYSVLASHLTSAAPVSPPNDLQISV